MPLDAYWNRLDPVWAAEHAEAYCRNQKVTLTFSGAFSAFGDTYSLIIPAMLLSNLQMPRRQKIGLYVVFSFGIR